MADRSLNVGKVETLFHCGVLKVVECLSQLIDEVPRLPRNCRERIFYLMIKRGLITDSNVDKVIDDKVRVFDLSESEVSDLSLFKVADCCRHLQNIDLNALKMPRTSVTSQGLIALARGCPHLQVVSLRRCVNMTDDGIVELTQRCHQLKELNIGGCHLVTDLSLHSVGENCHQMRSINFSKANVTDEGVMSLARGVCSDSLKEIHLDGCSKVTDESVEAIINFCPNISFLMFHGCPNITDQSRIALEQVLGANSHMMQLTWTVY